MWKLTSSSTSNSFISEKPFCFFISVLFIDNKCFDPSWDYYFINSAAVVFTKFEISQHSTFVEGHIGKFSESHNLNLQCLNYAILRWYLLKKSFYFTP